MSKQDINKVRTAQELEIKYDLSSILDLKRNYELQKEGLNKIENELTEFVAVTTQNIEDLQSQVDGNITTWFSSGVPTLSNYPASDWTTTEDKNNHLGDLYYDQDTGYAYRFIQDNSSYSWLKIEDSDVAEALAIANAAKDTADSKRRVFVVQPTPPYDVGDLWIYNQELYRCQTSKDSTQSYESNDWIKATKYTDDTVANQVDGRLTILSGTVTEIIEDVDELTTQMTNTTELVDEHGESIGTLQEQQSSTSQTVTEITSEVSSISANVGNNYQELLDKFKDYTPSSETNEIKSSVTKIQTDSYTKTEIQKIVNGTGVDGVNVTAIKNVSGTFDEDGMHYDKSGAKTNTTINEVGVNVKNKNGNKSVLFAGYVNDNNTDYAEYVNQTIVGTDNIIVKNNLNIGSHCRIQDYENGTGIFTR